MQAISFATYSLPLLSISFYAGNVIEQDKEGKLSGVKTHMNEVSENIRDKLVGYDKKEPNTFTIEQERSKIFAMAKDLWLLNNNAFQLLNLKETVKIAYCNFRNIKKDIIVSNTKEEIFCRKERILELQIAQLEADSAYLHNTLESDRVVLSSIEKHIDLEYTKELKESSRKSLSLQSTAFIIEFAIIFYYFLGSWYYLLGVEKFKEINILIRFSSAILIAFLLCACTHFFAEWHFTKKRHYLYTLLSLLTLFILTIGYIVYESSIVN